MRALDAFIAGAMVGALAAWGLAVAFPMRWCVCRLREDGSRGPYLLFRFKSFRDAALRAFERRGWSVAVEEVF